MKKRPIPNQSSDKSMHQNSSMLINHFIKKNYLIIIISILFPFIGYSQQRMAGVEVKDKLPVSTLKIDNAKVNFTFAILTNSNTEFTIQIFKDGKLYIVESKIPGTNLVMKKKHSAILIAETLIKKLQQGQSTVFSEEEIKTLDNY